VNGHDPYPTRGASRPELIGRVDPVVHGNAAGPLSTGELVDFDRDGYLRMDRLISPEEVVLYAGELARLAGDPALRGDERVITEKDSGEVRSVFDVHRISPVFAKLAADPRVAGRARQILGSDVYVHQSRVNYKPGFRGKDFYWHSDFETWHAEDGMPRMRAVSVSIALTPNDLCNGSLMIMPGSHRTFVSCAGETPEGHYRESLKDQEIGTPDPESLTALADEHGIELFTGEAGSAVMFDCNCMHGSNGNISPYPRSNVFLVFNSVENACGDPYAAPSRRPEFLASRDFTPVA